MELNKSTLKDFRKKIKSVKNEFERSVGEVLIKLVGEISLFPVNFYYHKQIILENDSFIPDYAVELTSGNEKHYIFIELKQYSQIGNNLLPQLENFYRNISKFRSLEIYREYTVHSLFVIDSDDDLTHELINMAGKYDIQLYKESVFQELDDLITDIHPQYGFLDFLKNKFNIMIQYEPKVIEKRALQNKTYNVNLLTFSMTARELLKLSYVYRANIYDDNGFRYQRLINGDRLNDIKKFIISRNFESVFPNNLICNFAEDSQCTISDTKDENVKNVKFENKYSTLWIIDGQHRLFSFAKMNKSEDKFLDEYCFTVTAYKTIKKSDQAKIFFYINDEQTGINANLVCYILSQLREDRKGAAASVALMLENMGVFKSKIYRGITREGGYKKTWINLKTFVDNLTPSNNKKTPDENLIGWEGDGRGWLQQNSTDLDTPAEILSKYFDCIKERFISDWNKNRESFVQNNAGIAVMLKLLLKILSRECNYDNPEGVLRFSNKNGFKKYMNKFTKKINAKISGLEIDEWKYSRNKSQINKIVEFIWDDIIS